MNLRRSLPPWQSLYRVTQNTLAWIALAVLPLTGIAGAGCAAESNATPPTPAPVPTTPTAEPPKPTAAAPEENEPVDEKIFAGTADAPAFPEGLEWINTAKPVKLEDYRGKFVVLDFWTYCCINCMHVIPELKKLEAKYPQELVVIGVHSAKFNNEKTSSQIRKAVQRYELKHPVVNDKDMEIWESYQIHSWPTLVLINPEGRVIGYQSGEEVYDLFDRILAPGVKYFDDKGKLKRSKLEITLDAKPADLMLSFPGKIASDAATERLIVSDSNNNRILITDKTGQVQEVIGQGAIGQADGAFDQATFFHPQGAVLNGDLLYIADTENHLIRVADLKSREVKTVLGTGEQSREFNQPGQGRKVAINSPWDLALVDGKLYIAMAGFHQLWVADVKTWEAKPFVGTGRERRVDGPLLKAALAQPSGLSAHDGVLYWADSETSSIRTAAIDPAAAVSTLVGEDLFVFGDVDGDKTTARLQHPLGVLYKDGTLYVADTYNDKIKTVDPKNGATVTFAGMGKPGGLNGDGAKAQFNEPGGLAALGDTLYVADTNNHKIRTVDLKTRVVGTLMLRSKPAP